MNARQIIEKRIAALQRRKTHILQVLDRELDRPEINTVRVDAYKRYLDETKAVLDELESIRQIMEATNG